METIRYPTPSFTDPNAVSDDTGGFIGLANEYQSLRASIMILMNDPNYKDYAAFTNHQYDPKHQGEASQTGKYASIEDVHNNIHMLCGGNNGHMDELDYAAYDPVFWLHHA
jgi:tyrosinase